jgi:hypothetical protein
MPDLILRHSGQSEPDESPLAAPLAEETAIRLLTEGEITSAQLVPWGSNYTFAVVITRPNGAEQSAIYKPREGEAPLYDFPGGTLYKRELASYRLSRRLGWNIVPPTIIRDGPHGVGSVQLYVEPDRSITDHDTFWNQCRPEIERIVLFDHIANNADRKSGHLIRDRHGRLWGIDHGLTFNHVPKLRTVLWQYVGLPVADDLLADLERLLAERDDVWGELDDLLSRRELAALFQRVETLVEEKRYPRLNPRRNVPYGWW